MRRVRCLSRGTAFAVRVASCGLGAGTGKASMRRREVLRNAGLAAVTLAAPAIRSAKAEAGKTLVFGGSVPLTGAAAETGLNVNNGYITAAAYMNEVLGGVEIAGEK